MNFIKSILTAIDSINSAVAKAVSWAILLIIFSTAYEVIARYIFSSPTKWSFEFNYLVHGIYFMLLGAYTLAQKGHVSVDILHVRLSPRARAMVDVITVPFFYFFIITMIWFGGVFALKSYGYRETLSSAWTPPIWPVKMIIPIAAILILLQGTAKLIRDVHILVTGREMPK